MLLNYITCSTEKFKKQKNKPTKKPLGLQKNFKVTQALCGCFKVTNRNKSDIYKTAGKNDEERQRHYKDKLLTIKKMKM